MQRAQMIAKDHMTGSMEMDSEKRFAEYQLAYAEALKQLAGTMGVELSESDYVIGSQTGGDTKDSVYAKYGLK